ncbi:MAG: hypothetical protein ABJN95_12665 [Maribacter sp.]|uniref:hypothetical protein n=1 Tax=Maribacter sp. TaxID=1897614 RepID=UPI003298838B
MKTSIAVMLFTLMHLLILAQENKEVEPSIIASLIGNDWVGEGNLMEQKATFMMAWESLWEGKFIKLEFQNKRKGNDDNKIVFKAIASYKIGDDGKVLGNWFDSRGVSFPLRGTVKENMLTILWGDVDSENGKTIYLYKNNNVLVEDFILVNGRFSKFGNATYIQNIK